MESKNQKTSKKGILIALVAVLAIAAIAFAATKLIEGGYLQGSLQKISSERTANVNMVKERAATDRAAVVKKMNDSLRAKNKKDVLTATAELKDIAPGDSEAVFAAEQVEKIYSINTTDAAVMDTLATAAQNYTIDEASFNTAVVETYEINQDLSQEQETAYVGEITLNEPVSIGEVWYYLPTEKVIEPEFAVTYADTTKAVITGQTVEGSEMVYSFTNPTDKEIVDAALVDKGYDTAIYDASKLIYAADLDGNVLFFDETVN